jgi:hypothetical protein
VTRSPHADEREMPKRQHEDANNVAAGESEIDQILADSFPASDAPPWTLGVASAQPERVERPKRQRGWLRK